MRCYKYKKYKPFTCTFETIPALPKFSLKYDDV